MKINEVEQLVGITKKNIRFYEDQGLISPERNKTNGYRDYSEEDVRQLLKIKLLRRLAIPIEEIRNLQEGRLTLKDCMERHQIYLNHETRNLEMIREMCESLSQEEASLEELTAPVYLERMEELEKGGNRFVNVTKVDVSKKKRGAAIAAAVMVVLMLLWDAAFIYLAFWDPIPLPFVLLITVPPTLVIIGVLIALRERMKEIEEGEADEARKY